MMAWFRRKMRPFKELGIIVFLALVTVLQLRFV